MSFSSYLPGQELFDNTPDMDKLMGRKCEYCDKLFSSRPVMIDHIRIKHAGHRPFVCGFCRRAFGRHNHLKVHMARVCTRMLAERADGSEPSGSGATSTEEDAVTKQRREYVLRQMARGRWTRQSNVSHCWTCFTLCPSTRTTLYETNEARLQHVTTHILLFRTEFARAGLDAEQTADVRDDEVMTNKLWQTCFPQCVMDEEEGASTEDESDGEGDVPVPKNKAKKGTPARPTKTKGVSSKGASSSSLHLPDIRVEMETLLQCNKCGEVVGAEDATEHYMACQT